ncbi:MAG: type 1 glutamine amidotransferase domain-containing protein [Syntrophales bacterium]
MKMDGKERRVAILLEELYNEFEFWYPYYRLREAGAKVTAVGSGRLSTFHSKIGLPATAEKAVDAVSAGDFDGVVIPGGFAPDQMRRSAAMVKLVRDLFEQGKVVAAICHAGWMLCSADILRGKTATSFFSIKDDMVHAGARWVDREVVVDGNLITSRKPEDLPAFMKAVIAALR